MDISTPYADQLARDDSPGTAAYGDRQSLTGSEEVAPRLGLWLRALQSYLKPSNHPLIEAAPGDALTRDWSHELRITRQTILKCTQLALGLANNEKNDKPSLVKAEDELDFLAPAELITENSHAPSASSLIALAETLGEIRAVCEAMLNASAVNFHAWISVGKILTRELERYDAVRIITCADRHQANANLQPLLLALARAIRDPEALGSDMLRIFSELARLLDELRIIENLLRRDQSLKQTLPLFALLHEETRSLLAFIETRAMRTENLSEAIFDVLDGTNYAIGMELRKVFAHELVNLSSLRQAPAIYAKVENAHGLLRDSFQQSTVALAQLFDPTLDGARLFNQFQTKLEQSLALRADLWKLLGLVRHAEKERDRYPVARLLERLTQFRDGSLRYLMYKDWEACERFIEEVAASRGAVELTPVLHRFGAYLETLHGQINMRAVLANHPFEHPPLDL